MTQRIFDVDNPQDVKDLFDILPDDVVKIKRENGNYARYLNKENMILYISELVAINWRDKTEITRPVDESQLIGKLCWFTSSGATCEYIGILKAINEQARCKYMSADRVSWELCRPVRRDEINFVEDS